MLYSIALCRRKLSASSARHVDLSSYTLLLYYFHRSSLKAMGNISAYRILVRSNVLLRMGNWEILSAWCLAGAAVNAVPGLMLDAGDLVVFFPFFDW